MTVRFRTMLKSTTILGLALLIVGGVLFGWVFAEQRKEDQLAKQRSDSLKCDLSKIDAAMGDQIDAGNLESLAYSGREREPLAKSARKEEKKELAMMLSSVFGLTGGTILSCCLLLGMARLVKGLCCRLGKAPSRPRRAAAGQRPGQAQAEHEAQDTGGHAKGTADFARWRTAQDTQPHSRPTDTKEPVETDAKKTGEIDTKEALETHTRQAAAGDIKEPPPDKENCEQPGAAKTLGQWRHSVASQPAPAAQTKPSPESKKAQTEKKQRVTAPGKTMPRTPGGAPKLHQGHNIAVLLSDEESVALEDPSKVRHQLAKPKPKPADVDENVLRLEDSMKAQTEDFEKRMEQFTKMAQSVQQTAMANARPVEQSIRELSQQVSAIREYAAHQQERVKKLQDGYDWNIIKNFCLRIIRCVDNLDSRVRMLRERQVDTAALEEVRDELLFALESTGVDQFEPEINSDYRGQEKNTEVVREKEECDDPNLRGRIAKVLRPGYHYFIDEDNVKLIRTAQVKLYC